MTVMLPGHPVSARSYVLRAAAAIVVLAVFSLWMIGRSTGVLETSPTVYADIPTKAGLIQQGAPVRYHGIKVGEISTIDAGSASSQVGLTIDDGAIDMIPRGVRVRVLPRTFFGDIYVQLVPLAGARTDAHLSDGDTVTVDSGPDAVNLYDIFTKMSDLIAEVKPSELNVALAAVDRAIGGRGDQLGLMIDDWWAASKELESTVDRFIDATPTFRGVVDSLKRATPDITATLASVTSVSRGVVDHASDIGAFLTSASGFVGSVDEFVADERARIIRVIDSTGKILATVGENPAGVSRTLAEADRFGAAGTVLFSSGRFNITAVPTFSQPMPYTAADCPQYGDLRGSQCFGKGSERGVGPVRRPGDTNGTILNPPRRQPVIDGTAERGSLKIIESSLGVAEERPSAATSVMVGPMVRGQEVTVR
ncbi:ABC transporter substrate-binding protein [Gordonia spumicola]|uniref:ABC transporter substrate-binding protein n=1 Tax=Gordonia spumicola TaxID=589161 RepID=A0A7I9V746_9ACTN|nr:MCE family protein [Gordonia spumicola]GEE00903.1 ABC transporter substrate-binding protein [Gordonia spumicola]